MGYVPAGPDDCPERGLVAFALESDVPPLFWPPADSAPPEPSESRLLFSAEAAPACAPDPPSGACVSRFFDSDRPLTGTVLSWIHREGPPICGSLRSLLTCHRLVLVLLFFHT